MWFASGVLLVAGVLVLVVTMRCQERPRLRLVGGDPANRISQGTGDNTPGDPVVWGSVLICLTHTGTATITRIEPVETVGGLTVDDFAVRPDPWISGEDGVGSARGDLRQIGFGTDKTVDVTCGSPEVGMELAVQASRPSQQNAASYAWKVSYVADGREGSFEIPVAVQLCGDEVAWAPACSALGPEWVEP